MILDSFTTAQSSLRLRLRVILKIHAASFGSSVPIAGLSGGESTWTCLTRIYDDAVSKRPSLLIFEKSAAFIDHHRWTE
jgi:hypothetical protein